MNTRTLDKVTDHVVGIDGQHIDKVKRYSWAVIDEQGRFSLIDKDALSVDKGYQREEQSGEVTTMAATWSWIACGALIVADREGTYWVVDGQQRLSAALRRSDIKHLPCIVFRTTSTSQEADGFVRVNLHRRAVSALDKYRAGLAAGYEVETFVSELTHSLGIRITTNAHAPGDLKAVSRVVTMARSNRDRCERVLGLTSLLCAASNLHVKDILLRSFWYIDQKLPGGVADKRFEARAFSIGADVLEAEAIRKAIVVGKGGEAIWSAGVLGAMNKGLRRRFALQNEVLS